MVLIVYYDGITEEEIKRIFKNRKESSITEKLQQSKGGLNDE